MKQKRQKLPPALKREEVAEIRVSLSGIRHSIEAFQSLSAHLDHILNDLIRLDHYMLVALARLDQSDPLPKEKKVRPCEPGKHQWDHVGTRTDSPRRCKKCEEWG